jgi:hypothetical protein
MVSKLGDSRKQSWDSDNSGCKPDILQDVKIMATEDTNTILEGVVVENDKFRPTADPISIKQESKHDFVDNFSLTSATTESGIDSASIGELDPVPKDVSPPPPSGATELDIAVDQINSIIANVERKESATLKVRIKRYPSRIKREYDVEEIKVEFHSESSSSESSDEDF